MNQIDQRINQLYQEFKGFPPKNPIVRYGTESDAMVLLAFEVLLSNYSGIKKLRYEDSATQEILPRYIVAPPDDSIDIFYEESNVDENHYHILQVKNQELQPHEVEACFLLMEKTIKNYIKTPKVIRKNLKEVIGQTDFSANYKGNIIYYVIHRGQTNYVRLQKPNQIIVTFDELEILRRGANQMNVPEEFFEIDTASNFIVNNFVEKTDSPPNRANNNLPQSLLCNFSGYDLARLNNKYSNTLVGRNILYGQNLRESLQKSSKTFEKMLETIDKEPELFLYYNNGITILSSFFDAESDGKSEQITVRDFSIINGAQTTSTLGAYLRMAELDKDEQDEKIQKLKKVYVLTKIYQINKELPNHEYISENIKIFSNTQTPLSSRDMVSIRTEQILLQKRFLDNGPPFIFINIKKGVDVPSYPKTYPHQRITNEVLAQLSLCGFFSQPFSAKDKKAKIFDNEAKEGFTLNEIYHELFDEKDGLLFKKNNIELDELLFVYKLHEDTKKAQKNFLKEMIITLSHSASTEHEKGMKEEKISRIRRNMEISNVCLFWDITTYFEIKKSFDFIIKNNDKLIFDYKRYYDEKEFRDLMIKQFQQLFYSRTVEIIRKNSGVENVNNWLRVEKNEKTYIDDLREQIINDGMAIKVLYQNFIETAKVSKLSASYAL